LSLAPRKCVVKPDARIDEHLGRRLRRRRRQLGFTQGDLAGSAGVLFQQIQKYECGASAMSASRIWQLADALGVSVSYFFDGLTTTAEPRPVQATDSETAELLGALTGMQELERRRLLDLMKAMHREPSPALV
jgi:transcriptional regulator with XRE-family HTH domain